MMKGRCQIIHRNVRLAPPMKGEANETCTPLFHGQSHGQKATANGADNPLKQHKRHVQPPFSM